MEYLDLYDENKNLTGEVIVRTKTKPILKDGTYINIIIIFIQNSKGEFLIQMTSKEKNSEWATTGGFVKSGDTSYETAIIEVGEELGLDISKDDVKLIGDFKKGVAIFDVYYLQKDVDIESLVYQKEEVDYVKWLSLDEIDKLISEGKFRKGNIPGIEILKEYLKNNHKD